jgi:hypothetical protein
MNIKEVRSSESPRARRQFFDHGLFNSFSRGTAEEFPRNCQSVCGSSAESRLRWCCFRHKPGTRNPAVTSFRDFTRSCSNQLGSHLSSTPGFTDDGMRIDLSGAPSERLYSSDRKNNRAQPTRSAENAIATVQLPVHRLGIAASRAGGGKGHPRRPVLSRWP